MCLCVCGGVHRLTHGVQRLTLGTFVFPSPPYILRQGFSLNLKLVNGLDWQAHEPSGAFHIYLSLLRLKAHPTITGFVCMEI